MRSSGPWECKEGQRRDRGAAACAHDSEGRGALRRGGRQYIQTEIDGLRGAILCNVLVRVSDKYALEMHIDVEEANALGVKNGDRAFFLDD